MLARVALSAGAFLALCGAPVLAGPAIGPIFALAKECYTKQALVIQCFYQAAEGDRNKAVTKQTVVYKGDPDVPDRNIQFAVTYQDGDDNRSWIEQTSTTGADQIAFHAQIGNNNSAYTYQEGNDQFSGTVQVGDGHWAATSSIGEDVPTFVYQEN